MDKTTSSWMMRTPKGNTKTEDRLYREILVQHGRFNKGLGRAARLAFGVPGFQGRFYIKRLG